MDTLSAEMQNICEGLESVKATQLIVQTQETQEHEKIHGADFRGQVVLQKTSAIQKAIEENAAMIDACSQDLKEMQESYLG
jgi:hypothetical protein